jgi:hypothetical protein
VTSSQTPRGGFLWRLGAGVKREQQESTQEGKHDPHKENHHQWDQRDGSCGAWSCALRCQVSFAKIVLLEPHDLLGFGRLRFVIQ